MCEYIEIWDYVEIYEKYVSCVLEDYADFDYSGVFPKFEGLLIVGYIVPEDSVDLSEGKTYLIDEYGEIISEIDLNKTEHGNILSDGDTFAEALSHLQNDLDQHGVWEYYYGSIPDGEPDEHICVGIEDW